MALDVRDSRAHNYPPRWNGAPSQDLLVIRRNHKTGAVSLDPLRWGLIPYWCEDPKGGRKPIISRQADSGAVPALVAARADLSYFAWTLYFDFAVLRSLD